MDFQDKHVIVTGASAGIGEKLALTLGALGANLTLFARREAPLLALSDSLEAQGSKVQVVVGDVTSASDRQRLIDEATQTLGPIDVLINNAGRADQGLTSTLDTQTIRAMMDLNFEAPLALTQLALAPMRARGSGIIVNVISHVVFHGFGLMPGYVAAKSALHAATLNLRYELCDTDIRVVGVYPGLVDTDFAKAMAPEGTDMSDFMAYMRYFRAGQRASGEFKRMEKPMKPQGVVDAIVNALKSEDENWVFPDEFHRTSAAHMLADPAWWRKESKAFYQAFLPPLRELMAKFAAARNGNAGD